MASVGRRTAAPPSHGATGREAGCSDKMTPRVQRAHSDASAPPPPPIFSPPHRLPTLPLGFLSPSPASPLCPYRSGRCRAPSTALAGHSRLGRWLASGSRRRPSCRPSCGASSPPRRPSPRTPSASRLYVRRALVWSALGPALCFFWGGVGVHRFCVGLPAPWPNCNAGDTVPATAV